jgi:uncharacterized Zn finger protein (UPF0148 family)
MTDKCDHEKAQITLDSGEVVCPICDDVTVETYDGGDGA